MFLTFFFFSPTSPGVVIFYYSRHVWGCLFLFSLVLNLFRVRLYQEKKKKRNLIFRFCLWKYICHFFSPLLSLRIEPEWSAATNFVLLPINNNKLTYFWQNLTNVIPVIINTWNENFNLCDRIENLVQNKYFLILLNCFLQSTPVMQYTCISLFLTVEKMKGDIELFKLNFLSNKYLPKDPRGRQLNICR